jgi:hypothetical protein
LIFKQDFAAADYQKETFSPPFAVGSGKVMSLTLNAPLNNSWLALDAALVNAQDNVVAEMDGEISYYQGTEGGEHWTEGSKTSTSYFRAPEPGTYRLLIKATSGSGMSGPARGERLRVMIHQGGMLSRYFLVLLILCALFPAYEILRQFSFHKQRWAPVMGDDEDDD